MYKDAFSIYFLVTPTHSKLNCSLLDLVRNLQTFNSSVKYNNMKENTFLILII